MTNPTIGFHGGAGSVTGSCYELACDGRTVLVDCGLFQGSRSLEALNFQRFDFDASHIEAVLVTHAHLDHSGLLPRLAAEGFSGPIYCTEPTRDLLQVMLADAARIQEQDAIHRNRRADRAGDQPIEPLYRIEDAERTLKLVEVRDLQTEFEAAPGIQAKFWNAGHILGSASVELNAGGSKLLFSGDLGPEQKAFLKDPQGPHGIDHVLCESTYGDRERQDETLDARRSVLESEITSALARGGNVVIPAFALERTQELLLDLARLMQSGRIPKTQVFIDSPLASRTTEVFRQHAAELEDIGSGEVFDNAAFHFTEGVDESIRLNSISGAIILSASGMCEGGRIRHHLRFNLPRSNSTILFVGFQAQGTLGRLILDGARRVRISGQDVAVRAQVRRIDSYSAHADKSELIAWVRARKPITGSLFLTHGERTATDSLAQALRPELDSVIVPQIGERFALPPGAAARQLTAGRAELQQVLTRDWQNDYADFAVNLKSKLQSIESAEKRRQAIALMRRVLDRYAAT